jgi:MFS family permease
MAFYGFGLAGIFVALLIGKFLHEPVRGASEEISPDKIYEKPVGIAKKLHSLLKRPELLLLMTAFACANSVAAIFLIWAPSFLLEKFHLSLVAAGFSAVVAIQLASAMSAPLSGMLADRLSCRLKGGRILLQASGLLLGIFCVVAVARATTLPMLITAMIAFGLCKGAYDAGIFASVFDLVSPEERASVAGLMNMLGWGGGALGPLALGFMATYAHGTPMERMSRGIAWSSLAYLLAAGLLLWAFFIFRKGERKPLG